MKTRLILSATTLLFAGPSLEAFAVNISDGNGHVDALPYSTGTSVEVGHYDFDVDAVIEDTRLFVREMDLVSNPTLFATRNPGFTTYAPPGGSVSYTLPANEDLNFNVPTIPGSDSVQRNVLYWDGEGTPDFGAVLAGEDVFLRRSGSVNTTLDGSGSSATGFNIETSNPDGEIHTHFTIMARSNDAGAPGDGFYLFAMQFVVDGLDDSQPVYMLFNADYDRDALGQMQFIGDRPILNKNSELLATDWVLNNLLATGPAADLSGDGDVDDEDLGLFFSAFTGPDNGPSLDPRADLSGDGDVDDEDLGIAFSEFTGPLSPTSVPEPSSAAVVFAGLGLLIRRRRALGKG